MVEYIKLRDKDSLNIAKFKTYSPIEEAVFLLKTRKKLISDKTKSKLKLYTKRLLAFLVSIFIIYSIYKTLHEILCSKIYSLFLVSKSKIMSICSSSSSHPDL